MSLHRRPAYRRKAHWHPPINRASPYKPAHPNRRFVVRGRLAHAEDFHTLAEVKSPVIANVLAWLHEKVGYRIVVYTILVPRDY